MAKKVSIYTTTTCHFCHDTKEFFKKNNISFEEFNVGTDLAKRKEMVDKSGQLGVPVITVDDEVIVGYDQPRLKQTLGVK